jgi:hypothetical protein
MDKFSLIVLERTLELATEAMPPEEDSRVTKYAELIRHYIDSPNSENGKELERVVTELADLAYQNRQFLIAARLQDFTRQFRGSYGKSDVA